MKNNSKKSKFRRVSEITDKGARTEISRAHVMIALLSVVVIVLLVILNLAVALPTLLLTSAVALLAMVALFSFAVAIFASKP
jgi:hypothetical protein